MFKPGSSIQPIIVKKKKGFQLSLVWSSSTINPQWYGDASSTLEQSYEITEQMKMGDLLNFIIELILTLYNGWRLMTQSL